LGWVLEGEGTKKQKRKPKKQSFGRPTLGWGEGRRLSNALFFLFSSCVVVVAAAAAVVVVVAAVLQWELLAVVPIPKVLRS
jgi:hypothetical protein